MKLKFLDDAYVNGELAFKGGEIYDIDDKSGSATRWVKRGIAIEAAEEVKVEAKVEVVAPVVDEDKEVATAQEKVETKQGNSKRVKPQAVVK